MFILKHVYIIALNWLFPDKPNVLLFPDNQHFVIE